MDRNNSRSPTTKKIDPFAKGELDNLSLPESARGVRKPRSQDFFGEKGHGNEDVWSSAKNIANCQSPTDGCGMKT